MSCSRSDEELHNNNNKGKTKSHPIWNLFLTLFYVRNEICSSIRQFFHHNKRRLFTKIIVNILMWTASEKMTIWYHVIMHVDFISIQKSFFHSISDPDILIYLKYRYTLFWNLRRKLFSWFRSLTLILKSTMKSKASWKLLWRWWRYVE